LTGTSERSLAVDGRKMKADGFHFSLRELLRLPLSE
jgi:hypothetical protein